MCLTSLPTIEYSGSVNVARMESMCWIFLCRWSLLGLVSVCVNSLSFPSSDSWRMFTTNWSKDDISAEYLKWHHVFLHCSSITWKGADEQINKTTDYFLANTLLTRRRNSAYLGDDSIQETFWPLRRNDHHHRKKKLTRTRNRRNSTDEGKQKHHFTSDWLSCLARMNNTMVLNHQTRLSSSDSLDNRWFDSVDEYDNKNTFLSSRSFSQWANEQNADRVSTIR